MLAFILPDSAYSVPKYISLTVIKDFQNDQIQNSIWQKGSKSNKQAAERYKIEPQAKRRVHKKFVQLQLTSLRNSTRQVVHKPPTIERSGCLKGENENSEDSKSFMKADTVSLHPELASYYLQEYFCVKARSLQGSWSELLNLQVRATSLNLTDVHCA